MRHRCGGTPEMGFSEDAVLPAVGLQQGVVVNGVAGHKNQFTAHGGLHHKAKVACQTAESAQLYRRSQLHIGPSPQADLQCHEPNPGQSGLTLKFAVTRALVVVHHSGLFRKNQCFTVLNHMAQVGTYRYGVVRRAGRVVQGHQRQSLVQNVNAKLRQALRVCSWME